MVGLSYSHPQYSLSLQVIVDLWLFVIALADFHGISFPLADNTASGVNMS